MDKKRKFNDWSKKTVNFCSGCENDCLYPHGAKQRRMKMEKETGMDNRKFKVCWTKKSKDGSVVNHESEKSFTKERAYYLADIGKELTGELHTIKRTGE